MKMNEVFDAQWYKALSPEDQSGALQYYFENDLSKKPEYTSLSAEDQAGFRQTFSEHASVRIREDYGQKQKALISDVSLAFSKKDFETTKSLLGSSYESGDLPEPKDVFDTIEANNITAKAREVRPYYSKGELSDNFSIFEPGARKINDMSHAEFQAKYNDGKEMSFDEFKDMKREKLDNLHVWETVTLALPKFGIKLAQFSQEIVPTMFESGFNISAKIGNILTPKDKEGKDRFMYSTELTEAGMNPTEAFKKSAKVYDDLYKLIDNQHGNTTSLIATFGEIAELEESGQHAKARHLRMQHAESIGNNTANALMQVGEMIAITAITKDPKIAFAMLAGQAGSEKYFDLQDRDDLSDFQKSSSAIATMGVAYFSEKMFGASDFLAKYVATTGGARVMKKGIVAGVKEFFTGAGQEFAEEFVEGIGNDIADLMIGVNDFPTEMNGKIAIDIAKAKGLEYLEQGIYGAVGGGFGSAINITKTNSVTKRDNQRLDFNALNEQYRKITKAIESGNELDALGEMQIWERNREEFDAKYADKQSLQEIDALILQTRQEIEEKVDMEEAQPIIDEKVKAIEKENLDKAKAEVEMKQADVKIKEDTYKAGQKALVTIHEQLDDIASTVEAEQKQALKEKLDDKVEQLIRDRILSPETPGFDELGKRMDEIETSLTKAEPTIKATKEDFTKENIEKIAEKGDWAVITGTQEAVGAYDNEANIKANEELRGELEGIYGAENVITQEGVFLNEDQGEAFVVIGITEAEAMELGKKYKQTSVLTQKGNMFSDGSGYNPASGKTFIGKNAESQSGYSTMEDGTIWSSEIDWDTKVPMVEAKAKPKVTKKKAPAKPLREEKKREDKTETTTVYRGGLGDNWVSEDIDFAKEYGDISTFELSNNANMVDVEIDADEVASKFYKEDVTDSISSSDLWYQPDSEFVKFLLKEGYDGFINGDNIFIANKKVLVPHVKTKKAKSVEVIKNLFDSIKDKKKRGQDRPVTDEVAIKALVDAYIGEGRVPSLGEFRRQLHKLDSNMTDTKIKEIHKNGFKELKQASKDIKPKDESKVTKEKKVPEKSRLGAVELKFIEEYKTKGKTQEKIANLINTFQEITPDTKIVIYEDKAKLAETFGEDYANNNLSGYDPDTNTLHLVLTAGTDTVVHEFMHPMLIAHFANNKKALMDMHDGLVDFLKKSKSPQATVLLNEMNDFLELYKDQPLNIQSEEYIAELMTQLNRFGYDLKNMSQREQRVIRRVVNWIADYFNKLFKTDLYKTNMNSKNAVEFVQTINDAIQNNKVLSKTRIDLLAKKKKTTAKITDKQYTEIRARKFSEILIDTMKITGLEGSQALTVKEIDVLRERFSMDKLTPTEQVTWSQYLAEAKNLGMDKIAQRLAEYINEHPRVLTGEEHASLVLRATELQTEYEEAMAKHKKALDDGNENEKNIQKRIAEQAWVDLDVITEATRSSGREAGRALNVRKMRLDRENYTLVSLKQQATMAKGSALTEAQDAMLQDFATQIREKQAQVDKLSKEHEVLELELSKKKAGEIFEKTMGEIKAGRKLKSVQEKRQSAKKALEKLGYRINDVFGITYDASVQISKIAIGYIHEGATSLKQVVEQVQAIVPEITEQDIYDSLGGRIKSTEKKVISETKKLVSELKTQARLHGDIGDVLEGIEKKAGKKATASTEVKKLMKQLHELKQNSSETIRSEKQLLSILHKIAEIENTIDNGVYDTKKEKVDNLSPAVKEAKGKLNELRKLSNTLESIEDYKNQIKTGKYKGSTKRMTIVKSSQLRRAQVELKTLQRHAKEAVFHMRKKTKLEKFRAWGSLPRTMLATGDFSYAFRQGMLLSIRRPLKAGRIFYTALQAMFSEAKADEIDFALRNSDSQYLRDRAGLYLTPIDRIKFSEREEEFASDLAEKIPGFGKIVKASERNMVTGLNMIRATAFDSFAKSYPYATDVELRAFANYVNSASGRGTLGGFEASADKLSSIFFAPRFAMSRIQTPFKIIQHWKHKNVRKEIAKDAISFLGVGMLTLFLAHLAGAKVSLDPEDSAWGKIQIGKLKIDIWSGFQQPMRMIALTTAVGLDRIGVRDLKKNTDLMSSYLRFMSYKSSPMMSAPVEIISGKSVIGQERELWETALGTFVPLAWQDMGEVAWDTRNPLLTAGVGFMAMGGISIGYYDKKSKGKNTLSLLR